MLYNKSVDKYRFLLYIRAETPSKQTMNLKFNERRTAQTVAMLLRLRNAPMSYLKLMKLLYLVERESLIRWGRPFTFDRPVSMKEGPVLSNTLNLIKDDSPPQDNSYWKTFISPPCGDHEIKLLQ